MIFSHLGVVTLRLNDKAISAPPYANDQVFIANLIAMLIQMHGGSLVLSEDEYRDLYTSNPKLELLSYEIQDPRKWVFEVKERQ
jgi:hypothetical protein